MTSDWPAERRAIIRDAIGIGIAVAAYGFVFGAQGVATGLSLAQTMALSLLMFTGASQFALVGVLGAGGTGVAAALTALMLGARNALYGLRMAPLLQVTGAKRLLAAQWTIDESTAMRSPARTTPTSALRAWPSGPPECPSTSSGTSQPSSEDSARRPLAIRERWASTP